MLSMVRTPAFLLLILSPLFAEIISGATPLAMVFNPAVVLLFVSFYGSGALLIRELTKRWQKGWPTILLLGAAFAMVEEGLMTKVFFNPSSGVSPLVNYGRLGEVNWPLVLQLIPYHTIVSIAVPIFLTTLIFSGKKADRWVGDGKMKILWGLFFLSALFGTSLVFTYPAPPIPYFLTAILVGILYKKAKSLPEKLLGHPRPVPKKITLIGLGALFNILLLGSAFLLPGLGFSPFIISAFLITLMILSVLALKGWASNGSWSEKDQLALVTGVVAGLLIFNVLLVILGRVEMVISIIMTLILLTLVWKRV